MKQALIIIDIQKDFCQGGVLPAKNTSTLVLPLNQVIAWCEKQAIACVFTRDWHPLNHCSFQLQGGPWPTHCVQNTVGAEFADMLYFPRASLVIDIEKDTVKANMSYSAFENTTLEKELRARGIVQVTACGIATDYCVMATVMDALRCGFQANVLIDLIRPIDANPGDAANALLLMKSRGAKLMMSREWIFSEQSSSNN